MLDGQAFIHTRVSEGSVNPVHVREQFDDVGARVEAAAQWWTETSSRLREAHEEPLATAARLSNNA